MGLDQHRFRADHNAYSTGSFSRAGSRAGRGALRVALLFGSAALALTLILVPILNDRSNQQSAQSLFPHGVDTMKTGSITKTSTSYTIRKSVLQHTPQSTCIITSDGRQSGDC